MRAERNRFAWSWLRATLAAWRQRIRDRYLLSDLSEWQLRDIGLSRDAIDLEAGKPLWRA